MAVSGENNLLKRKSDEILNKNEEIDSTKETIKVSKQKIAKVEAASLRAYQERNQEAAGLEYNLNKKELNATNKILKEKDKEIYRLAQKNENLSHTIKNTKSELNSLNSENKKLVESKYQKVTKASSVASIKQISLLGHYVCSKISATIVHRFFCYK